LGLEKSGKATMPGQSWEPESQEGTSRQRAHSPLQATSLPYRDSMSQVDRSAATLHE